MGLATVKVDIAPVYEKPSIEAVRKDELLYGMSVQIIQESDTGWCYVRTEYQLEGYMPTACLLNDAEVAAAWRKYKKSTVLAPYVDVQKEPDNASARVVSMPRGGIVVPLGTPGADGWQKVGLAGGDVGYTRASYLGDVIANWQSYNEDDLRWNIVETALSYNGCAWRAGGRSPLGIDAAGLVAMSYQMNGIIIPRPPEARTGGMLKQVDPNAMNEGDIIVFSSGMGVYMGDERFVHATDMPGGEGVVVNSLRAKDEDYRADLAGQIRYVASVF